MQCSKVLHRYITNTTFGMANQTLSYQLNDHFEQQKNTKAAAYTAGVAALVLLFCIFVKWSRPQIAEPIPDTGVEVNLGNSDFGSGETPPMMPGEPAPEAVPQQVAATPPAAQPQVDKDEQEPDPEDKEPAIAKTVEKVKSSPKPNNNPVVSKPKETKETPAPPQPKPKATMGAYSGGNGKGGNNQDGYNNVRNQGIAGGTGDQGKANGNINSDNYKGNGGTGSGGVTVVSGNRAVVRATRLQGDFTQSATLIIQVKVSPDGSGSFVRVVKGLNESQYTSIIKQRLTSRDIQFSTGDEESFVNIQVVFKVN